MSRFYTTLSWQNTSLGTPIPISSSAPLEEMANSNPILLMGGIHGDEPEGVRLAVASLNWLRRAVLEKNIKLVPWIVIPCLNMDGYAKRTRVNGRGVDLNRNYPSKDWSPAFEKDRYYPGPAPASELEIQGVVRIIQNTRPRLIIHCHSWKPCIVATGEPARRDAQILAESSGYELTDTIGYPTPGSLSRYGWIDNKIPIICIEEQDEQTDLSTIWPRFEKSIPKIFTDFSERRA